MPSLHNTRWNSRAIYALIRISCTLNRKLHSIYFALSSHVHGRKYGFQIKKEEVYNKLKDSISILDCSGAMKCFTTHWNLNKSILDVPRTNICAERAIKLMKELLLRKLLTWFKAMILSKIMILMTKMNLYRFKICW